MANAVELYIRAAHERDPAIRASLLESCFAADGRLVTTSRELRGRAAVADMLTRFHGTAEPPRIRVTSAVDLRGTIFRFRSAVDSADGTTVEFFDAGELDADGRIKLIVTFAGPLADA
jgi:hypothetical protein